MNLEISKIKMGRLEKYKTKIVLLVDAYRHKNSSLPDLSLSWVAIAVGNWHEK